MAPVVSPSGGPDMGPVRYLYDTTWDLYDTTPPPPHPPAPDSAGASITKRGRQSWISMPASIFFQVQFSNIPSPVDIEKYALVFLQCIAMSVKKCTNPCTKWNRFNFYPVCIYCGEFHLTSIGMTLHLGFTYSSWIWLFNFNSIWMSIYQIKGCKCAW